MINSITIAGARARRVPANVPASGQILKSGSALNARVSTVATPAGLRVLKDFSHSPFLIRHTLGRFLIRREFATLRRLQGLAGVPVDPVRLHAFAISYRFVPGETLATLLESRASVDQTFFPALEKLVAGLHARGFVHLDLRNGRNMLRTSEGQPRLLDFQAGLWLPALLRRPLEAVDLSGVYKWWARLLPGQMNPQRTQKLRIANHWRRLWRFNYPKDDRRLR
jgi:serine/threonine protein kinase